MHAALGEPARLAIVDELALTDLTPKELSERLGLSTNLLAHHLDVLERAALISRTMSSGDGRRRYVRLARDRYRPRRRPGTDSADKGAVPVHPQLRPVAACRCAVDGTNRAAAGSAGTRPAPRVHRQARRGRPAAPVSTSPMRRRPARRHPADDTQVVTVCDLVHEELEVDAAWWHWSIPDPVERGHERSVRRGGRRARRSDQLGAPRPSVEARPA